MWRFSIRGVCQPGRPARLRAGGAPRRGAFSVAHRRPSQTPCARSWAGEACHRRTCGQAAGSRASSYRRCARRRLHLRPSPRACGDPRPYWTGPASAADRAVAHRRPGRPVRAVRPRCARPSSGGERERDRGAPQWDRACDGAGGPRGGPRPASSRVAAFGAGGLLGDLAHGRPVSWKTTGG
jgi:hypothetical protein